MGIVYAKIRNTIWYQTLKVNVGFEMKILNSFDNHKNMMLCPTKFTHSYTQHFDQSGWHARDTQIMAEVS